MDDKEIECVPMFESRAQEREIMWPDGLPDFRSKIPDNALNSLSPDQRWLAVTLSVMDQKIDFMMKIAIDAYNLSARNAHAISVIEQRQRWTEDKAITAFNRALASSKTIQSWTEKFKSPLMLIWGLLLMALPMIMATVWQWFTNQKK